MRRHRRYLVISRVTLAGPPPSVSSPPSRPSAGFSGCWAYLIWIAIREWRHFAPDFTFNAGRPVAACDGLAGSPGRSNYVPRRVPAFSAGIIVFSVCGITFVLSLATVSLTQADK